MIDLQSPLPQIAGTYGGRPVVALVTRFISKKGNKKPSDKILVMFFDHEQPLMWGDRLDFVVKLKDVFRCKGECLNPDKVKRGISD